LLLSDQGLERASGNGEFFAVSRQVWAAVCAVGLNQAVAYLVLARFSGLSNATTAASVNAIECYTAISRGRARAAIESLCASGIVSRTKGGRHPRHNILPAGHPRTGRKKSRPGHVSNWIWLPNSLVTPANEVSPLELVRAAQDVMLLKLFVELYDAQNLRDDGGISRDVVFRVFEREQIAESGNLAVWGFRKSKLQILKGPITEPHERVTTLEERSAGAHPADYVADRVWKLSVLGLLDCVPHVFESDAPEAEIIHPYGLGGGAAVEDRIGRAAQAAGQALLTPERREYATAANLHLLPLLAHHDRVALVGVGRMRHRAQTQPTSAWEAELEADGTKWIEKYEQIRRDAANTESKLRAQRANLRQPSHPPSEQYQGSIKARSRTISRMDQS
jgi:hypothetical protein